MRLKRKTLLQSTFLMLTAGGFGVLPAAAQTAQSATRVQPIAAVSAKKKPDEHGLAPLLRRLFSARAGNT